MKYTTITCAWCGKEVEKRTAEIKRQNKRGRYHFFCSRSCSVQYGNSLRENRRRPITKVCPQCNQPFETMTGCKEPTFCSRECASKGSVTPSRMESARRVARLYPPDNSIESVAAILLSREMWKYEKLKKYLDGLDVVYQFEYPLGNGVYDLALLEKKLFIEFDGVYHNNSQQQARDKEKDAIAHKHGWSVYRIKTDGSQVLPPAIIADLVA